VTRVSQIPVDEQTMDDSTANRRANVRESVPITAGVHAILDAALSPDGRSVVYSVIAPNPGPAPEMSRLVVVDVMTGTSSDLTTPGALDLFPVWSADCNSVIFLSDRAGPTQLFRADVRTGRLEQLTNVATGVAAVQPAVSPDGERVALAVATPGTADPREPYRVTTLLWRLDGVGRLASARSDVFVLDLGRRSMTRIGDRSAVVTSVAWSPDGRRLLDISFDESDDPRFTALLHDLAGGRSTTLWQEQWLLFPPRLGWLPDGRVLRLEPNATVARGEPAGLLLSSGTEPEAERRT
jgi:Tol biopolymer transport system component